MAHQHLNIGKTTKSANLDTWAIGLSALCVFHCLALPLVIMALPFMGFLSNSHWVHQLLILIAAPISAVAIWRSGGWRNQMNLTLAIIGIALLAMAAFVKSLVDFELPLSIFGACILAYVHWQNSRIKVCNLSH